MSDPFLQDPDDNLDYTVDWSDWLGSDTILTSSWSVTPTGPTLSSATFDNADKRAVCFFGGGTNGLDYDLLNHITTAKGRTKERGIRILVRDQ